MSDLMTQYRLSMHNFFVNRGYDDQEHDIQKARDIFERLT